MRLKKLTAVIFALVLVIGFCAPSLAAVVLQNYPKFQVLDNDGNPAVGGKLYTYIAGTSTPTNTYSNSAGTVANTNPVILNSRGEADVYLSVNTKIIATDADDNVIWTKDNLFGPSTGTSLSGGTWAILQAAITAAGSTPTTFQLSPETWTITSDLTFPSTISLKLDKGTILAIYTTKTLTINGPFEAGLYQVFYLIGTGKVDFGNGSAKALHPEWWGGKPDNATDSSAAFAAWMTACISSGIEGKLSNGTYKINTAVAKTMASGKSLTISGQGGGTVIDVSGVTYTAGYPASDVFAIDITGTASSDPNNAIRLSNFRMIGGASDLGNMVGLRLNGVGQTILSGVIVTGMPSVGIELWNIGFALLSECYVSSNYYAGVLAGPGLPTGTGRSIKVFGGEYNSNGCGAGPNYGGDPTKGIGYGLVLNAQQIYVAGARCYSNDRYGIDFRGGSDVVIDGSYVYNSGLIGIHGLNYDIATGGGINLKIINNTVDNADRVGSTHGMEVGPWDSPAASVWGVVNEILIKGNTVKRCLALAIMVDTHKTAAGATSLKKLIINNNQVEHTDPTDAYACRQICVGNYTSVGAGTQYVDSSVIQGNILVDGGIFHGDGDNADISHNKQTWMDTPYSNELIRCYADNSIQDKNTITTVADLTLNPLLRVDGGGVYSGLSRIRSMIGNTNNGRHLPHLWDWIYNNSELSFKYAGDTVGPANRMLLELVFSGAVKKTALLKTLYSRIGGTGASPTNVAGEFNEGAIVDDAGAVTFAGASPYTLTPVKETALGAGPPSIAWKLISGVNTIGLYMNPNADSLIESEVKVRYSGTIASMIVRDPVGGADYIQ